MEIKASASFMRISPRKLMLIAEAVKRLPLSEAITKLNFLGRNGAEEIRKVLLQARANAVNNFKLKESALSIREIQINNGPTLKRGRPVSRGMWHTIKKRTSHIKVVLEEKAPNSKS